MLVEYTNLGTDNTVVIIKLENGDPLPDETIVNLHFIYELIESGQYQKESIDIDLCINGKHYHTVSLDSRNAYIIVPEKDITNDISITISSKETLVPPVKTPPNSEAIMYYIGYIRHYITKIMRTELYFQQKKNHMLVFDTELGKIKKYFSLLPESSYKIVYETYSVCKNFIDKAFLVWNGKKTFDQ